jgi:hypothetical protein
MPVPDAEGMYKLHLRVYSENIFGSAPGVIRCSRSGNEDVRKVISPECGFGTGR